MFNYKIPDEIKNLIPIHFYYIFYGELCALYGAEVFDLCDYEDEQRRPIYDMESTIGWAAAFWAACYHTDMEWLWDYYESLPWYDSDLFDDEMCETVVKECHGPDGTRLRYYDYILRKMRECGVKYY